MPYQIFLIIFLITFGLAIVFTLVMKKIALKLKLFDWPSPRRIHPRPVPRLGGIAIFLSFLIVILFLTTKIGGNLLTLDKHLVGFLTGATLLVLVMIIDDIRGLSPWVKLFWQIIATLIIIACGIGIEYITNPLGGIYLLNKYQIPLQISGATYHITVLTDLFTIVWVVGMINVVNFLDGLDGLAAGVAAIAGFVLFFLSLSPGVNQPTTAVLAIALAGCSLGFLIFNFHPAKIFMGDSGSHFLGFTIALLAIFSGAKVATALLVLGFPVLDGGWVVLNRIFKKHSPFLADKTHFHHRLLELGISQRQAVIFLYFLCACFGMISLFLKSKGKLIAFSVLGLIMTGIIVALFIVSLRKKSKETTETIQQKE
jgi:UDP-GlcNAc:undecaprenyl-phosphate/decaprenyl-phosphate GlcNAc-1-phosphate transferase